MLGLLVNYYWSVIVKFNNIQYDLTVRQLSTIKLYIYELVTGKYNWFMFKVSPDSAWELIIYDVITKEIIDGEDYLEEINEDVVNSFLACGCKESEQIYLLDLVSVYDEFARQCAKVILEKLKNEQSIL